MKLSLLIFLFGYSLTCASAETNLEIISKSIDSLAHHVVSNYNVAAVRVKSKYEPLRYKFESSLKSLDSTVSFSNSDASDVIIDIDSVSIVYLEKSNERQTTVSARIYSIANGKLAETIYPITITDTIETNNITDYENRNYDFTRGVMIEETSFWEDALEPIVFVGSAAVIIYLLFTVRSS